MKSTKKSLISKIAVIAASTVIVLFLLMTGVELWLAHKVRQVVDKELTEATGGRIRAEIGRIRFSLPNRSVRLRDIVLKTDTTVAAGKLSALKTLDANIEQLLIQNVKFEKEEHNKTLSIGNLELTTPRATILLDKADTTGNPAPAKSLRQQVSDLVERITIGRLGLVNAQIEYCEIKNGKKICHTLGGLSLNTNNLDIDVADTTLHGIGGEDIRASINKLSYQLNDNTVTLEVDTLAFSTKAGTFSLSGIRLIPRYPWDQYASIAPGHTDWTQVIAGNVSCTGVDFGKILDDKTIRIDSVSIRDVSVSSFKNRKIAQKPRIKQLFYESIQRVPFAVDIRRIHFSDINAEYRELAPYGELPGKVTFHDLHGDFFGLTNIPSTEQPFYKLTAQGKLMDRGTIDATFLLPVDSLTNRFEVTGKLGSMDMASLNPIITPLVNIQVDSGQINEMDFHIAGTDKQSTVNLVLRYRNLNIALIKTDGTQLKERKFLSAVVDDLLIKHDNPDDKGLRKGSGTTERNFERSQFNYLWKSLFPGIKETVIGPGLANRLDRKKDKADRK